jgi:hypothetical protein
MPVRRDAFGAATLAAASVMGLLAAALSAQQTRPTAERVVGIIVK